MDNTQDITCLSLCSGYGGLELGLQRVIRNLHTVAYVEVEAFACANLVSKMEKGLLDAAPIWTDIKTFNAESFRDRIHIITAGYPCQPFSVAGKRKGESDPRHLWPHIERIIEAVRPVWFFGENVSGHLTIGFPAVYRSLRNMGYTVEARLVSANECLAPHRRLRVFILAKSSRAASSNQDRQTKRRIRQENVPQGDGQVGSVWTGTASELENTRTYGRRGGTDGVSGGMRRALQTPRPSKLADTKCPEQRQGTRQEPQTGIRRVRPTINHWPARPGQPQYEWEEPRVVENTRCRQQGQCGDSLQTITPRKEVEGATQYRDKAHRPSSKEGKNKKSTKGQTQPRLGRATSRRICRLDKCICERNDKCRK